MATAEARIIHHARSLDTSICARCAFHGNTCCQCRPGEEELLPPVSEAEREWMIRTVPWAVEKTFLVREANSERFIRLMGRLFPDHLVKVDSLFPPDGWHYRLAIDRANRCVLLGSKGCMLPALARPLFCRIFPFWFIEDQPQIFEFSDCLALQTAETVPELCSLLGTSPGELTDLHHEICRTWGFDLSSRLLAACS